MPPGNYKSTINVTQPETETGDVELTNVPVPPATDDGEEPKLPPPGPVIPRVETTSEILNLTLHQVWSETSSCE